MLCCATLCYAVLVMSCHVHKGLYEGCLKIRSTLGVCHSSEVNDLDPLGLAVEKYNLAWYIQQLRVCVPALWGTQRRGDSECLSVLP